ncbi:MAG TPA: hypothetical protein VF721_06460 [Pyrinomonadaceae bacterium]|jgi:small-conductance mechanosensitive channel
MYQKSFLNATEQVGHQTGLDFIKKLAQDAMSPQYRTKALIILWVILVIVLVILSLILYLIFNALNQFYLGVVVITTIWALFFGVAALFFLSGKWLTTLAGSILGVSASDLGTKSGPLAQANDAINGVAVAVARVLPTEQQQASFATGGEVSADPFTVKMVWLFIIILGVLCIPAFFSDSFGKGKTNTNTGGENTGEGGNGETGAAVNS